MISGTPSLFVWSLSELRPTGITPFVRQHADHHWLYGSGKAALRDALSTVASPGENVLIPSYLPDAVVEPIRELGLEARHYAISPDLSPDFADLEDRIDDRTLAVMSVNYFGFPQPGLEELSSIVDDYDCYHIDDNAHAALSVDDGVLLGTRGHIGITSLWKLLPIPNGAILYLNDDSIADRFEPSQLAGPSDTLGPADGRFVVKSIAADLLDSHTTVRNSVNALLFGRDGETAASDPIDRYEASKTRMSKLSVRVMEDADPESIRTRRRANYRAWQRVLEDRPDADVLFPELPSGICPQVCPVHTQHSRRFRRTLQRCGVGGVFSWPRLSPDVLDDPAYETATRLSQEIVALPVHQQVDPKSIESIGDRLEIN
ncbi:DegT/DnrJ/EryC1/StrS family aminotransferase [Halobacteria archaeon AArc-m2/3/4]|uniref:DegT/DnrJ/EryC1/StrS family aminotransferase n=1 Tax=Natronoglomus mannanivorans TaxID=2979990 RepID=A0ABT2QH13_9EURY|nr:DegT/DnrJ/EryC1/StrS family aminotransferase [Halobacteria archaeon AArc-m2/3/4]